MKWETITSNILRELPPEIRPRFFENPLPVLINRYQRKYFVSAEDRIRITLDTGVSVFDQRHAQDPNFGRRSPLVDLVVLEIKFNPAHRSKVSDLVHDIPVILSRHSKYTAGVAAMVLR